MVKNNWKIILFVGLLIIAIFGQMPLQAYAQGAVDWDQITQKKGVSCSGVTEVLQNFLTCAILLPVSWVLGLTVALAAWLITLALTINATVADTSIVQSGFAITLSIANLGFVFAIIVIAFATIIDYESYGIKKNLWKLIAAAILVNFSLVICSAFISFFDQFAFFFAKQMGKDYGGVANQLVNAFGLQKLSTMGAGLAFIPALAFSIIFTLLISFTLFGVAGSLIVRYIYLIVLMIIMPFAWLCWTIPGLEKQWSAWWSNFIKWTMYPAIILTFLYIAVTIATSADSGGQFDKWTTATKSGPGAILTNQFDSGFISLIIRMVVALALVWGALIAAQSLGAQGTGAAMKFGKWVSTGAKNKASQYARRGSSYPLGTGAGRKITEAAQTLGTQSNWRALRALSVPIRGLGNVAANKRIEAEKEYFDKAKQYKDVPIIEQARRLGTTFDPASIYTIQKNIISELETSQDQAAKANANYTTKQGAYENVKNQLLSARKKGDEIETQRLMAEVALAERELTSALKQKTSAENRVANVNRALSLLPGKARNDLLDYQRGLGGTKMGRMFVLYGEHEKKAPDNKIEQIEKILNEGKENKEIKGEPLPTPPQSTPTPKPTPPPIPSGNNQKT